jgi:hypothetical protein
LQINQTWHVRKQISNQQSAISNTLLVFASCSFLVAVAHAGSTEDEAISGSNFFAMGSPAPAG